MEMAPSVEQGARDYWTKCLQARLVLVNSISTSASSKETLDHARNVLFIELKAIKDLITLTMIHVNDLSVTVRLPAEVLSHVFALLSDCNPPSKPGDGQGRRRRLGWITVTHVCRHWRQVALSMPVLWTNIGAPQTGPWMDEMLMRSKQAPFTLSAYIAHNIGVCNAVLKALSADHVWRMKGLCLSDKVHGYKRGHFKQCRTEVLAGLKYPAPMLESLVLESVTESDTLPPDIFAGNLPSLRRFAAQNLYGKGWDASRICNLTDLELDFQVDASLATLLILLKNSPALENVKIVISKDGTPCESEEHLPEGKIFLFSLKMLYFSSQADTRCIRFLASLIIPSTARMEFKFLGSDVEKMLRIISLIPAFIGMEDSSALASPSWMRLACSQYYAGTQVSIDTWLEEVSKISGKPPFSMQWNILSPAERIPVVQWLLASFDLRRVTYLILDSAEFDETIHDTFKELFSRMSGVREVMLRGLGIGPLLALLETMRIRIPPYPQTSSISEQETIEDSPLFPNLTRLKIATAPFGKSTQDDRGGDQFGNLLLSVVQKRSALGARIHTLELLIKKRPRGSKAMLDGLRKHVEVLCYSSQ